MAAPTRTEQMLTYLCERVRKRAATIDGDPDLSSLTLVIRFNHKRPNEPFRLLFKPEAEIDS